MRSAIDDALDMRAPDPAGLSRVMTMSFGVHIGVIAALLVVPREWLVRKPTIPTLMTITIAGTPGPRSTGMTPIAGRKVEEVAPEPKRPEPIKPVASKPDDMVVSKTPPPKVPPKPPKEVTMPSAPTALSRGRQVTDGSARADTGATGKSIGLTVGGGTSGDATTNLSDFCCPAYIELMKGRISENWTRDFPERGETVMQFTIQKDGTITRIEMLKTSGSGLLDRASQGALRLRTPLPPLPVEYTNQTLTIVMSFKYEGR